MKDRVPSKIDVAVLILFFNRDAQFGKVFEAVRKARPSRLYLYQDGPRKNSEDMEGILRCRKLAENIDWECEVKRCYQEKNYGCDPSEYMAQKWFFANEEMGIVLEDDDVPSQSFFPFCKELLERYKDDERINMICGMNNLGEADWCPYSYLFAQSGSVWGWASWRRVYDELNELVPNLDDPYYQDMLRMNCRDSEGTLNAAKYNNESETAHYETIFGINVYNQHRLNIVPTKNMISNIGISATSTHSVSDIKLIPRKLRSVFFMDTHEIDFPLKHPPYMMRDFKFEQQLDKKMGSGRLARWSIKAESFFLRCRHKGIMNAIKTYIKNRQTVKKYE